MRASTSCWAAVCGSGGNSSLETSRVGIGVSVDRPWRMPGRTLNAWRLSVLMVDSLLWRRRSATQGASLISATSWAIAVAEHLAHGLRLAQVKPAPIRPRWRGRSGICAWISGHDLAAARRAGARIGRLIGIV